MKEDLLSALYCEFINRVNEVGVDVNKAIAHPHTQSLVQYVCGLGPRKGSHLLKAYSHQCLTVTSGNIWAAVLVNNSFVFGQILKQNNNRLENRTQLVTMCHMGPKVFINCAGFIKIDTASLGDRSVSVLPLGSTHIYTSPCSYFIHPNLPHSTDSYIEVLDGSRVHPETYEWARKMAVDALEYDESAEDANPAGALEEILENPERLKDLDLDAFAEELERQVGVTWDKLLHQARGPLLSFLFLQGYGNKGITLYDIRAELSCRYKDLRVPYRVPNTEEVFNMVTKETPETFYIGNMFDIIM